MQQVEEELGPIHVRPSGDPVCLRQNRPLPEALICPLSDDATIKAIPLQHFPADLFLVSRSIMILRGLVHALGLDLQVGPRFSDPDRAIGRNSVFPSEGALVQPLIEQVHAQDPKLQLPPGPLPAPEKPTASMQMHYKYECLGHQSVGKISCLMAEQFTASE